MLGVKAYSSVDSGANEGLQFLINKDTNLEYLSGDYEVDLSNILTAHLQPGDVVFDIGAHYGYHTLMASNLVGESGKVFAFEPNTGNFEVLQKNIQKNSCDNVFSCEIAVSDRSGDVVISNSANSYANTVSTDSPVFLTSPKVNVACVTLDEFVALQSPTRVDFIKIDVEGHEYAVLVGSLRTLKKFHPKVYLATHDNHSPNVSAKCISLLSQHKYSYDLIVQDEGQSMKDFLFVYDG